MSVFDRYLDFVNTIRDTAEKIGRDPSEIQLVAVTKTHSLAHVMPAYEAGCRDFGENKVQEALLKIEHAPKDLRWHLIGTLQKNKVRKVVGNLHLIHSVDSFVLAEKLSQCSEEEGVITSVLLQANTSGEVSKHGFSPEALRAGVKELAELKGIALKGLMTMAPFVEDQKIIRECFRNLFLLRNELQGRLGPGFKELSMGMTHDFPIAIEEGATILRIGTAIFGERSYIN